MDDGDPTLPTGELPALQRTEPTRPPLIRPLKITVKWVAFIGVVYVFVVPLLPEFRDAIDQLVEVQTGLLVLGLSLQVVALLCYSLLTRAALPPSAPHLSVMRVFRIQLSTKALSHIVPGGNAAGSALGYRLLTLSGVSGTDAGFALATAGIGSAVILNLIFWMGLVVSIPLRGVNWAYGLGALVGVIVMGIVAGLVFGLVEGQGRAEKVVRWLARKLRLDEDKFARALRSVGTRVEDLISDRALLKRVAFWATLNWLIDAASLWVFIRAFGGSVPIDGLIVAFGLANVMAAIPITPGGLGYVDVTYVTTLVGFGLPRRVAQLGVASYRLAQFFFPILLGALAYTSLRLGPWKIERRDRLVRLRELARRGAESGESRLDFALRFGRRDRDDTGRDDTSGDGTDRPSSDVPDRP